MKIAATCIDTGGHHTQAVHEFCRSRYARQIYGIKGAAGPSRPIWPKAATRNLAKKTETFILGVDNAKAAMQARLMITERGPGYCHFPNRYPYDKSHFDQVTAEKALTKYKNGHPYKVWEKAEKARNEAWDVMVYNYAAMFSTGIDIARRLAELQAQVEAQKGKINPAAVLPPGGQRRRVQSPGASA